jgi:hypothetical protein
MPSAADGSLAKLLQLSARPMFGSPVECKLDDGDTNALINRSDFIRQSAGEPASGVTNQLVRLANCDPVPV